MGEWVVGCPCFSNCSIAIARQAASALASIRETARREAQLSHFLCSAINCYLRCCFLLCHYLPQISTEKKRCSDRLACMSLATESEREGRVKRSNLRDKHEDRPQARLLQTSINPKKETELTNFLMRDSDSLGSTSLCK